MTLVTSALLLCPVQKGCWETPCELLAPTLHVWHLGVKQYSCLKAAVSICQYSQPKVWKSSAGQMPSSILMRPCCLALEIWGTWSACEGSEHGSCWSSWTRHGERASSQGQIDLSSCSMGEGRGLCIIITRRQPPIRVSLVDYLARIVFSI